MVGLVGLEPTTLCSQSRCASQLRYSPMCAFSFFGLASLAPGESAYGGNCATARFVVPE